LQARAVADTEPSGESVATTSMTGGPSGADAAKTVRSSAAQLSFFDTRHV